MSNYDSKFFDTYDEAVLRSARATAPYVLKIVNPKNVVDFGCGIGTWLKVFKELGVKEVLGIDGDWVETAAIHIQANEFLKHDLTREIRLDKKYDLAISLEVAEHLGTKASEGFVRLLTNASDVVLFSAAIPFQGGTKHVNEQWQSYWKDLFEKRNFIAIDCIRPLIWENREVKWWYAQNTILYVKKGLLQKNKELLNLSQISEKYPVNIVHPRLYEKFSNYKTMSIERTVTRIIKSIVYKMSL